MNSEKSIVDLFSFSFFSFSFSFHLKNRFKGISLTLSDLHNLPRDNIKVSPLFFIIISPTTTNSFSFSFLIILPSSGDHQHDSSGNRSFPALGIVFFPADCRGHQLYSRDDFSPRTGQEPGLSHPPRVDHSLGTIHRTIPSLAREIGSENGNGGNSLKVYSEDRFSSLDDDFI
jgi:hypothetical protein